MFIIHQQWKRCAQKVLPVWSCPLLSRFWPCVSTGRHCCAADLHTGLKAACGLWETHEPAPVGLQKSSLSLTPFHQQRWNTNWFHLRPQRAQIKVCEAWLHRACTIHKWNPQRVSVISVRCKTIMTHSITALVAPQWSEEWLIIIKHTLTLTSFTEHSF